MPRQTITIVGAGLAGSLGACALAPMGFGIHLYERRPDPRVHGFRGGRSINLALSTRGLTALARVGLAEGVLESAIPMPGRMMHGRAGDLHFQPYSADPGDAINSIGRADLNILLLEAADAHANVTIHFDMCCTGVEGCDGTNPAAQFHNERTGGDVSVRSDLIIGADGAYSAVRAAMQITDRFNYSQQYLDHGYKELTIPAGGAHDGFAMAPGALHIWPRRRAMMIALPNQDKTFTCTLFWPFEGEHSFAALHDASGVDVRTFFENHYPDAAALMPALESEYAENPIGSLVTIRCEPWHRNGRVLLVGDAAHAIVPFFGQGMNAAFEDVRLLCEAIEREGDLPRAVETFAAARTKDADAIGDMAIDNFVEMRDRVADVSFLFRKRVERALYRINADRFMPLYNLVSFGNIPYAEAKARGDRTTAIAEQLGTRLAPEADGLDDTALIKHVRAHIEREAETRQP